jgi:hypothetical protein
MIKRDDKTSLEYLFAYGATCFGNGLNRKSYTHRVKWVLDNWDDILKFLIFCSASYISLASLIPVGIAQAVFVAKRTKGISSLRTQTMLF